MQLFLVRHAQSVANTTHVIACEMPGSPLSVHGLTEADALAAQLIALDIEAVYHSRMRRTAQTIAPLAARAAVTPIELSGIHEVQLGDLAEHNDEHAHRELDALATRWNIDDAIDERRPDGESGREVLERMTSDFDRIRREHGHSDRAVVVVAHGLCLRTAAHRWAGGISAPFAFHNLLPNTGIITIDVPANPAARPMIVDWAGLGVG
ncbi:MAG: histidine phosphatase family protein [Antricoccus sp.]